MDFAARYGPWAIIAGASATERRAGVLEMDAGASRIYGELENES